MSAPPASAAAGPDPWRRASWVALVVLVVLGVALLASRPNRVGMDQFNLLASPEQLHRTPILTDGPTAKWIAAAVRSVTPPPLEDVNFRVRALALAGYLGAAFALARNVLPHGGFVVAFLALLFASRMPFLWCSFDLFSGIALCLFVLGLLRGWGALAMGVTAGAGALTKLDMPGLMGLLLVYDAFRARSARRLGRSFAAFAVTWLVITGPFHLQAGSRFYDGTRSFTSFGQHYSLLFYVPGTLRPMNLVGGDLRPPRYAEADPFEPFGHYKPRMRRDFPGADTVPEAIRSQPGRYLAFLERSLVRSAERIFATLHLVLPLVALRYAVLWRRRERPAELDRIFAVCLLGLVPMVLLAFVHMRYLARFMPLFLLVALDFHARLDPERSPRWLRPLTGTGLVASFGVFTFFFVRDWSEAEPQHAFWFPD